MKIVIDYSFTTLNEYIRIERGNKFKANDIKCRETGIVKYFCVGKKVMSYPCKLIFTWHVKNKRKDLDNIAFAKKSIIDGLVKAGTLENDNLNKIQALEDKVIFDTKEYVEVVIEDLGEQNDG